MSDQEDRARAAEKAKKWEQDWASNGGEVIRHMAKGGWSPWTSVDRYQMALQSVPLGFYERQATGEAFNPVHGENTMDKRIKALNAAVAEAETKKALSDQSPWVRMYGNPLTGQ